jgi:hypothetical protein
MDPPFAENGQYCQGCRERCAGPQLARMGQQKWELKPDGKRPGNCDAQISQRTPKSAVPYIRRETAER